MDHDDHKDENVDVPAAHMSVRMNAGVKRIEAFARATRGRKGHIILAAIAVSIYLCNWVYSMEQSTTYTCTYGSSRPSSYASSA